MGETDRRRRVVGVVDASGVYAIGVRVLVGMGVGVGMRVGLVVCEWASLTILGRSRQTGDLEFRRIDRFLGLGRCESNVAVAKFVTLGPNIGRGDEGELTNQTHRNQSTSRSSQAPLDQSGRYS